MMLMKVHGCTRRKPKDFMINTFGLRLSFQTKRYGFIILNLAYFLVSSDRDGMDLL